MAITSVLKRTAWVLVVAGMFSSSYATVFPFLSDIAFKSPWVPKDTAAFKINTRDTSIVPFEGTKLIRFDYNLDALDSLGQPTSWSGFGYWMFIALNIQSKMVGPTTYLEFALQGPTGPDHALRINIGSTNPDDTSMHRYAEAYVPKADSGTWTIVNVPIDSFKSDSTPAVYLAKIHQVDFSIVGANGTKGTGSGTLFLDDVVWSDTMNSITQTSKVRYQAKAIKSAEATGLTFRAAQSGKVTLTAFSLNGEMATRFTRDVTAGNTYSVSNQDFSSKFTNLSSGSYYVRVTGAGVNAKGILIR